MGTIIEIRIILVLMLVVLSVCTAQSQPRVVFPNGGEHLVSGDTVMVRWEGVPPTDTVRLSYSPDEGKTWMIISDQAVGLSQAWKVPAIDSQHCQLRVTSRTPGSMAPKFVIRTGAVGYMNSLSFSPNDSLMMVTGQDKHSYIYNRYNAHGIRLDYSSPTYGQFDRLGQYALTVRASGGVNVWVMANGSTPFGATTIGENAKTCDFSHDNKRVLVAGATTVQVFDYDSLKSGSKTIQPLFVYRRDKVGFTCAEFSPGDSLIAIGCTDRTVDILRGDTYELVRTFTTYPGTERLHFSRDGRYIAATGNSDILGRVWDVATGNYVRGMQLSGALDNEIVWGRGDSVFATVGYGGTARIWDAATMTELYTIPSDHMRKVAFSHDGNFLVVGRGDSLMVWSIPRGPATVADVSDGEWSMGTRLSVEGVSDKSPGLKISTPRPNPAQTVTDIAFDLTASSDVHVTVNNRLGQEVVALAFNALEAGRHEVPIDVSVLPVGMYYCTVRTPDNSQSRPLFVVR